MARQHGKDRLAAAVAALFLTQPAFGQTEAKPQEGTTSVKCAGINECKGKSACSTATNACSGQNACKGKGWLETKSEKECKEKGGKVIDKGK